MGFACRLLVCTSYQYSRNPAAAMSDPRSAGAVAFDHKKKKQPGNLVKILNSLILRFRICLNSTKPAVLILGSVNLEGEKNYNLIFTNLELKFTFSFYK